ncbi:MAG: glycoside hydrolase family 99-like domain-containing protein [Terricaulis sp.]
MRSALNLIAAPVRDVASEGDAPAAILRVSGPAPRLALRAPDDAALSFSPGDYVVEVELRAAHDVRPQLICAGPAYEAVIAPLRDSAFAWSVTLTFARTVTSLTLALDGLEGAFVIGRCSIATEAADASPSIVAGLRHTARALYHKAPRALRRLVTQAVAPFRVDAHRRAAAAHHDASARGGHIRVARAAAGDERAELEARRADFDARFAIARGIQDELATPAALASAHDARAVAFYLPQFHRIAENDAWWGAGFTEWTNVSKAVPQFVGHHQPRLPGELGFYDLTAPDMLRRQVDLARAGGISAFCFHYYWFAGKRLLEKPLDAFVADRALDLGFTLCWANENWTRRWDGAEDAVLIAQSHSREDHTRVFDDMARYLEDPRALRIDGKPLVLVYRPAIIPDAKAMTEIWRERAHARGWPGVFIAATNAFQFNDRSDLSFDALVEFPPHGLSQDRIESQLSWLNPNYRGVVFDYAQTAREAIARLSRRTAKSYPHFPGVMPGWDNEARKPGASTIFHGETPEAYARWLAAACETASRTLPADRRLVFINAWNEWAEGAYLEPDRKWGRAFLDATAAVMTKRVP